MNWPSTLRKPEEFHQSQYSLPVTGPVECVTTAVLIARNMANELLAFQTGKTPLPDLGLREYVEELDKLGWKGLTRRVPTQFPPLPFPGTAGRINPRGFMLPRSQARNALRHLANHLRGYYGSAFMIRQSAGNTIKAITEQLQQGNLVLASGMNPPEGMEQRLLGGSPHTLGPVLQVDPDADTITVIDTGLQPVRRYHLADFIRFWGRKSRFNIYSKPFTMTVVLLEPVVKS